MIGQQLKKLVQGALVKLSFAKDAEILFEHPENPEHGDYSTNVALVLAKQLGKNPQDVAKDIVSKFKIQNSKFLDKVEVKGPGFINFFLSQEYFLKQLQEIAKQKEKYGKVKAQKKKVMMEFTDPNPFKEFHIGHLYSNAVGESIARLFEATGAAVKRANYQGDVGLHVAKAVWGMKEKMRKEDVSLRDLAKKSLTERARFLGQAYSAGDKAYETGDAKKEINELNEKVFKRDKDVLPLYEKGRAWSLEAFEQVYKLLGTKFDYYYFESQVAPLGVKQVEAGLKKGVFQESQGAITFPGEKYGLHTRVFINSAGLPTYEAKDLGLAPTKYKDFPFDLSLSITGNEQKEYFKVVFQALKLLNPELGEKLKHLSHGVVRLPEGKMSSRTGKVVTAEQLVEEVKARAKKVMDSSGSEISQKERQAAVETIAVGAIKYSLLRVGLGKDIVFDFDKSLSLDGESGPYLQYTYARCRSILRQAKLSSAKLSSVKSQLNRTKFAQEEEKALKLLYRFPEVVQKAADNFSPNLVASFVFDVAQAYNNFYNTHRVLQAETKEQKEFRLLLTAATAHIIQNSLHLLGMKTLERM